MSMLSVLVQTNKNMLYLFFLPFEFFRQDINLAQAEQCSLDSVFFLSLIGKDINSLIAASGSNNNV